MPTLGTPRAPQRRPTLHHCLPSSPRPPCRNTGNRLLTPKSQTVDGAGADCIVVTVSPDALWFSRPCSSAACAVEGARRQGVSRLAQPRAARPECRSPFPTASSAPWRRSRRRVLCDDAVTPPPVKCHAKGQHGGGHHLLYEHPPPIARAHARY